MDRDELSKVIAGILKMLVKATQQDRIDFDEDLAHEQILYLIAPELEKARLWDRVKEIAKEWCHACGDTSACKDCIIELTGLKPVRDAVKILHNRYIKDDPERLKSIADERKKAGEEPT